MEKEKTRNSLDGSDSDDYSVLIYTKGDTMNAEISRDLHPMEIADIITNFLLMLNHEDRIKIIEIAFSNIENVEMNFWKRPKIQ